ncbi:hypothetical protein LTS08_005906 [Lithohypha guttulata]|uniref:uncharacterized protein n=1 Tax=Lithohypha guttulata TaxID=1690604 RepID=UPI002DE109F0|nr:hypothetical protein LTR51_002419 [Lithohypha guttulata]KAK5099325.1 hypothetical protein LTS08_005906 [Lithohypha guttulata]
MLLTEAAQPFFFTANSSGEESWAQAGVASQRRQKYTRSRSSASSGSFSRALRLADIAKQHGFGMHVENWREDLLPVRQYLPMQHIIGSLKRDRDQAVNYVESPSIYPARDDIVQRQRELAALSPGSEDSFLDELRSPKRRRTSDCSRTESQCTTDSDPDRRFSYQTAEHVAKDIPQAALPGLNHVLNLSTITADERDIFTEYAPKHLDDSQLLMTELLQMRENMINGIDEEDTQDSADAGVEEFCSPVLPPEREAEVEKAFEDFLDLQDNHFLAKIVTTLPDTVTDIDRSRD